jgi:hypothetical protein
MLYNVPPFILDATQIRHALGVTTMNNLPDPELANPIRLRQATPLVERLWRFALRDIEYHWGPE